METIEDLTNSKVCKICGKRKPLNRFNIDLGYKDNHINECKSCYSLKRKKQRDSDPNYYAKKKLKRLENEEKEEILNNAENILGGYKIYIHKYTKRGEYKFNITSTEGELYQTSEYDDFQKWLNNKFGNI